MKADMGPDSQTSLVESSAGQGGIGSAQDYICVGNPALEPVPTLGPRFSVMSPASLAVQASQVEHSLPDVSLPSCDSSVVERARSLLLQARPDPGQALQLLRALVDQAEHAAVAGQDGLHASQPMPQSLDCNGVELWHAVIRIDIGPGDGVDPVEVFDCIESLLAPRGVGLLSMIGGPP